MNIYVGNLPKSTNEDEVRSLFEKHGVVADVKLIKDQYTRDLRGFGFIEMPARAEALKAIQEVNGAELDGRSLIVNEAKPRGERSGGGHGGGERSGGGQRNRW